MAVQALKQKGIALITVLLIVAIVTIISAQMAFQQKLTLVRSSNRFANLAINEYLYGAEQLVATVLQADAKMKDKTDSPKDPWAQSEMMVYPLPNGEFSGKIIAEDGKININDLLIQNKINNTVSERLNRLFELLKLDKPLINAIIDWLDKDQNATYPGGAEDDYYLALDNPYRCHNGKFFSIDELLLVKGFTAKIVAKLRPHITALPENSKLNINVASAEVLQSLAKHIDKATAENIIAAIKEEPFKNLQDFLNWDANKDKRWNNQGLDVKSQFFLAQIQVKIADTINRSSSLFKRNNNKIKLLYRKREI